MRQRISFVIVLLGAVLLASFAPGIISRPAPGIKTVVIDAGHGGKDPGCHGEKFKEKDVALAVALKLGKYIEENYPDIKVVYTRKTDIFLELGERAAIANRAKADLFICIHCNASPNKAAHGSETYVMGLHKTKGNLDVAKRENASALLEDDYKTKYAGFDANSDEWVIEAALMQSAYLENSLSLASKIQGEYKNKAGRVDKGVKQAGFLVLWKTAMPSLLTEIGFLTNPEEEKFLGSEKGQDYIASALFRAFRSYKNEMEGVNVKYEDELENQKPYEAPKDSSLKPETQKSETKKEETKKPEKDPVVVKKDEPKKEETSKSGTLKPETQKSETQKSEAKKEETKKPEKDPVIVKKNEPKKEETSKPEALKPETVKPGTEMSESELIAAASKQLSSDKANDTGVFFRVQIASSDKPLGSGYEKFKDIEDIIEYPANGSYKYTAGNFREQGPAIKLQNELRKKGFPDAFVVAYRDGKRIPVNDANKSVKP